MSGCFLVVVFLSQINDWKLTLFQHIAVSIFVQNITTWAFVAGGKAFPLPFFFLFLKNPRISFAACIVKIMQCNGSENALIATVTS